MNPFKLLCTSIAFFVTTLICLQTPVLAQGCECGDQVLAYYSGRLQGTLTITVGTSSITIVGGASAPTWVKGEGWVLIPAEEEVTISFNFSTQPTQSGEEHGVNLRFGCGGDFDVREGVSGVWRRSGVASASDNSVLWFVRRVRPNADENVPGNGCDSDDDGGAMPGVAKPFPQNYGSAHPAASAGMSINLGGWAGDLAFGGTLKSSGTFANRNNIQLYPFFASTSKRVVYAPGNVLTEILAKDSTGAAVAHFKIVDITNGFEIQVSTPSGTTGSGPWTPGTRQVTYRVTTIDVGTFEYGASVKKLVGSNPGSPSQTTEARYYGSLPISGDSASYEKHTVPATGNVLVEYYSSLIASGNRTVTTKEEEIQGGSRVLASQTVDVYRMGIYGQEIPLNHKTYVTASSYLETAYTYYADNDPDDIIKGRLKSRSDLATGDWVYYRYESFGYALTTHEFGPWLGNPSSVPISNPTVGSFAGRLRSTSETYFPSKNQWKTTLQQDFINNILVSERSFIHDLPNNTETATQRTATGTLGATNSLVTTTVRNSPAGWSQDLVKEIVNPDGSKTKYSYDTIEGQEVVFTSTESSTGLVNNQSRKEVRITDLTTERLERQETYVYLGSDWVLATATDYTYLSDGRLNQVKQDGVVIEQHNYSVVGTFPLDRVSEVVDQFGVITKNEYDERGRLLKSTKKGASTAYTHPAMGDIITEYTYTLSASGHQVTTRIRDASGGLFVETSEVSDLAGRLISSNDEQGMTTTYTYAKNIFTGRSTVTETRPQASPRFN